MPGKGRRVPTDWGHVDKYPWGAVRPSSIATVEKVLALPSWHKTHDQGEEGSCVGHGTAMERAIVNSHQNVLAKILGVRVRRYNPLWTWEEAKKIDEWPDTNPGDDNGTSVRAAYDVLRNQGAQRVKSMRMANGRPYPVGPYPVDVSEGVSANRWATTVDEIRTAIALEAPVAIGVNWYSKFYRSGLIAKGKEWWITDGDLGRDDGGHCVCLYGASDRRQAFKMKNSWGSDYPEVWLPYSVMSRLLNEEGEAAIVTDR